MKHTLSFPALILTVAILVLSGCAAPLLIVLPPDEDSVQLTTGVVYTHILRGEVEPVPGATAALVSDKDSATFTLSATELVPSNVYTAWIAPVNNPQACENHPCTAMDVMATADMVLSDVGYADGQIANEFGQARFQATLPIGPMPGGWYGHGLDDPRTAEIHVVLHDHGPVIDELRHEMLTTFRSGCTDASIPPGFPEAALADGTPGPNECIHYQFVIFQQ